MALALKRRRPDCSVACLDLPERIPAIKEAGITEQVTHFFRVCVSRHVEIFWCLAEQQVANATTHQVGLVTVFSESLDDF